MLAWIISSKVGFEMQFMYEVLSMCLKLYKMIKESSSNSDFSALTERSEETFGSTSEAHLSLMKTLTMFSLVTCNFSVHLAIGGL